MPDTDAPPSVTIRALVGELTELPANPTVAMRVLQLLDDPTADGARLGRLVETDPSLAAQTLRLANAPIHGMTRRISSARQAVMILGFELVRSLAALTASGVLDGGRRSAPAGFWRHSLMTAAGAMVLARHTGRGEGEACSVGLLHDLGAALQFRAAPDVYDEMIAETADDPVARAEAERRYFEIDHAEAGAAVVRAWGFPGELVEALADHHRLPVPHTGELVLVVRAGEALGGLVEHLDPGESVPDAREALSAAGIDAPELKALVAETAEQAEALRSVLL